MTKPQIGKLLLPLWMSGTGLLLFDVDPQAVPQFAQQACHRRRTDEMAHLPQTFAEMTQTTAHPFLLTHRIACRFRQHQGLQRRF